MARPRSATVESAAAEARAVGYEPLENYPGTVDKPWKVRCSCQAIRITRLALIRKGKVCGHRRGGSTSGRPAFTTTPEQAADELRKAGYEPDEPYPGGVSKRWKATCTTCGNPRLVHLADVRRGRRCAHQKNYDSHVQRDTP